MALGTEIAGDAEILPPQPSQYSSLFPGPLECEGFSSLASSKRSTDLEAFNKSVATCSMSLIVALYI